MKEFISLLISFVFMGIADNIDSAFNNAISVKVPKAVKEEIDKKLEIFLHLQIEEL